jgi:circadian clock protein KaiC
MIGIEKCPTGIRGLDEVTSGGLPKGRPTLVCGSAGCGKTLLGMEFIARGALDFGETGVFMSFEESPEELAKNVTSLGFDMERLQADKRVIIDHVKVDRSDIEETGEYDLEGLFIRLNEDIESIGAVRVVLDTIESLFSSFQNEGILRSELRRLFRWLKTKGVTAIITGEQGEKTLTRNGLEEYVSDCVIVLDHRVKEQTSIRRLRIVKYRGSEHGTNEYPFLIDESGINVLPITSVGLGYDVSSEHVASGIPRLDFMLGGKGFYRGCSGLISGTAGTGKTSFVASFASAACNRGERCLYFAFEESTKQIIRNMRSIGIDLEPFIDQGLLRVHAARPTLYGLEKHLLVMSNLVSNFNPDVVVVDPISNLVTIGSDIEVKSMMARLIDLFKSKQITSMFTSLTGGESSNLPSEYGVSSLMDTWIMLQNRDEGGERNRNMFILKSRGMAHSNQTREFLLTDAGVDILDAYVGPEGVLTGSARYTQEAREREAEISSAEEIEFKRRELERNRKKIEAQIAELQAGIEAKEDEIARSVSQSERRGRTRLEDRQERGKLRKADSLNDEGAR